MLSASFYAIPSAPTSGDAVLDAAEPLRGARAIVVSQGGPEGLNTLCGLIRRGCDAAIEITPNCRVPAEPAELIIFPAVASFDEAKQAIDIAKRCLLPCGRLVLQLTCDTRPSRIIPLLHAAGFSALRSQDAPRGAVLSANWPMFGPKMQVVGHA